jgi:hypothetical protein
MGVAPPAIRSETLPSANHEHLRRHEPDCAVWLVNSWLLLRDTNLLESKKSVARAYIASAGPRLRVSAEVVVGANAVPLEAIPVLLR